MAAEYEVFLSHAWANGDRPWRIADALIKAGLSVWFDVNEISRAMERALRPRKQPSEGTMSACQRINPEISI